MEGRYTVEDYVVRLVEREVYGNIDGARSFFYVGDVVRTCPCPHRLCSIIPKNDGVRIEGVVRGEHRVYSGKRMKFERTGGRNCRVHHEVTCRRIFHQSLYRTVCNECCACLNGLFNRKRRVSACERDVLIFNGASGCNRFGALCKNTVKKSGKRHVVLGKTCVQSNDSCSLGNRRFKFVHCSRH